MNINNVNATVSLQDFCDLDNLCLFYVADITPEELFNMFFGGFGGATMSGGKKASFHQMYTLYLYSWLSWLSLYIVNKFFLCVIFVGRMYYHRRQHGRRHAHQQYHEEEDNEPVS